MIFQLRLLKFFEYFTHKTFQYEFSGVEEILKYYIPYPDKKAIRPSINFFKTNRNLIKDPFQLKFFDYIYYIVDKCHSNLNLSTYEEVKYFYSYI